MAKAVAWKTWTPPIALLLLALAVRLPLLASGQIDYDEGVYWQSLRALAAGHPLFSSVYSSQPPGFLLLLAPFYDLFGHSLAAARAGVALLSLLGVGGAYLLAGRLAGHSAGLAAAALLAIDPLYLRQSITLQADGPALALALAGLGAGVLARDSPGRRGRALAGFAGLLLAVACLVKLLALPALLPALVLCRRRRTDLVALAAGAAAGLAAVLLPFADRLDLVLRQSVGLHLGKGAAGLTDLGSLGSLARWELPLLLLALISAVLFRRSPLILLAGAWLLLTAAAFAVLRPLWPHHLVAATVPLALVAGPGLSRLGQRSAPATVLGSCALAAFALVAVVPQAGPPRSELALRIAEATAAGEPLVTDDQFAAAAAGRSTPPELVDTSFVRVRSGDLTLSEIEKVVARDRVHVLVLGSGRLAEVPGLLDWLASNYPPPTEAGGASIYEAQKDP